MTSPSQVGFQPRTTPGERRADIDLRRKIAAINANLPDLSDYYTKSEADAQFLTESEADALFLTQSEGDDRYVNETGDEMTGRLTVSSDNDYPIIMKVGPGDTQTIIAGYSQDGATRLGYLNFLDDRSARLDADVGPLYLRAGSVDGITIPNGGKPTVNADPTAALGIATKQYVDASTNATRFTSTGTALSGTYAGEATVNTLNFTLPVASHIHFTGILFVSKTATDRHLVSCYLDGSGTAFNQIALLGLAQATAFFSYGADLAAGAHTILVRMIRDSGANTAQVFADSRSNRTDLLAVPS